MSREDTDGTANGRGDEPSASYAPGRRYTVHEAALLLGLSVDAVRKRAERGTLLREKGPDGTVYILLDSDRSATRHEPGRDSSDDQTATSQLLGALRDQVAYLRQQLATRDEEIRRRDHLLAAALERIPELEAPPAPRGAPETATEGTEGVEERPLSRETQEGQERRPPWWRRWFAG